MRSRLFQRAELVSGARVEFAAKTMWSVSNAFTGAFKKLDPVPQFKATAKLGGFLAQLSA